MFAVVSLYCASDLTRPAKRAARATSRKLSFVRGTLTDVLDPPIASLKARRTARAGTVGLDKRHAPTPRPGGPGFGGAGSADERSVWARRATSLGWSFPRPGNRFTHSGRLYTDSRYGEQTPRSSLYPTAIGSERDYERSSERVAGESDAPSSGAHDGALVELSALVTTPSKRL